MLSQVFRLPWDHGNAPVLTLKLATFFLDIKSGSGNNAYMLLKFQKAVKQRAAKPILDYFQRVCDAKLMHETFSRDRMSRKLPNPNMLWLGKRLIEFLISCHSFGSGKHHNILITLIISDLSCLQFKDEKAGHKISALLFRFCIKKFTSSVTESMFASYDKWKN